MATKVKAEKARVHSDCSSMVIMRNQMSISSNKVCRMPVGSTVIAKKIDTEWSQVQSGDKVGFVMNQFLIYGDS